MEAKLNFSKQQKKSLKAISDSLPAYKSFEGAESFLLCYIAFETLTRKVWNFHRSAKANKEVNETHAPLPLPAVKSAFVAYNIKVSDNVLNPILNSTLNKRGAMNIRSLRNGLVHQWKVKDRDEVLTRYDEIMGYLDKVIKAIEIEITQ
ncbi:hypothetical protein [Vibrio europaeus]|uniref:RiboL-PSP-HEPN domain-containing protein n=1 Tax=Vibrio europaeus TaxID=300876 RepID=A0ABT5H0H8_9VIBR|nr:hypothetical protein [Vibrio europaeus]MDC5727104.1 hypothetical protein [Vibrio europaeus]MDC5730119.1 hypothetical protein [Vibrio europaeus]MDC5735146.1 hypothetical protein [Vibrio europaeus]MDC5743038.1 hypothetical protein [Vibrio europaeus]MDC5748008.1 hypothetical protein [Vibrio europaeus]